MTPHHDWFARIEELLTRLSCDSVIEPVSVEGMRARLDEIARLLEQSGHDAAHALAGQIRTALETFAPAAAGAVVEDMLGRWGTLRSLMQASPVEHPFAAPPPADARTTVDLELETLASDPELSGMFVAEALDHLGTIEHVLLQLETQPGDTKLLNDVFRPFHTIKGNAGALGVTSVQGLAHAVENLLDLARAGKHPMGPDEFDIVLKAVDLLSAMIGDLPARIAGQAPLDVSGRREALMGAVTALIARGGAPQPAALHVLPDRREPATDEPTGTTVHAAGPSAGFAQRPVDGDAGRPNRRADDAATTVKVDTRKLDNLIDMVGELVIAQSILAQDPAVSRSSDERLERRVAQLNRITSDLQRNVMAMRMVPIRQTFQKMARLVRDLSKRADKPIELVLHGEDTELDRRVVEDINDPLMHMIRNSVDHGVEPTDVRLACGKPAQAVLQLRAFHQAGSIVIEVADDGAGLDTDRIYAKAVERGLVAPGASLPAADIHQLVFQPGFSTVETVTEISGRGVGMDVVRRNIEALRGQVEIQTVRGRGTTFVIRLPLTLAIVDGILLGVGTERFVLPTFAVRESLRPLPSQVHSVHGQPCMVQVRERLIPTLHIGDLFSIPGARRAITESTVVVVEEAGRPVALVVDELLGKQEVVIKSLGAAFRSVRGVAGGAILGDGRVGLILDAGGLIGLMGKSALKPAA